MLEQITKTKTGVFGDNLLWYNCFIWPLVFVVVVVVCLFVFSSFIG